MRDALKEQLEWKRKNKSKENQNDICWMRENIEKVNKEISVDEQKQRQLRLKQQRINEERM